MPTRRIFASSLLGAAFAAALGSVAVAQPMPPYPPGWQGPPPRQQEVIPVAPGAAYVWAPGHWSWNGRRYRWVRGHYVLRRPGWHHWVDGHWAVVYGQWRWIPGHWG